MAMHHDQCRGEDMARSREILKRLEYLPILSLLNTISCFDDCQPIADNLRALLSRAEVRQSLNDLPHCNTTSS